MYNQNNLWPQLTPLGAYGYATQPMNLLPNNVLQQNVNQLSAYYNPNQSYGQQYGSPYNYFGSPLIPQQNQSIVSPYMTQTTNHSFSTNTLTQSYPSSNPRPQTLTTIQTTDYIPNNTHLKSSGNEKWLNLLNASQKQVLDQLNKETEAFEQQFQNWEKDFENWKQVNRSHPDSSAYQLYVNQWQEWRQKLLERQKQMKDLRERTLQQLYSQVKPQINASLSQPPPPPNRPEVPPPPPPAPPEKNFPPLPSEPHPSGPQKRFENIRNENNFRINSKEMQTNDQNSKNKDIEVIEIDCEPKESEVTKSVTNADPTAVSKAAEALLFIQKQQELLKSLENLKSVNTDNKFSDKSEDKPKDKSSDDLQVIEPKPFDIKDIVTKMKAIRPPENAVEAVEANRLLSTLPSLQGIVFQPKPQNDEKQQQIDSNKDLINKSFGDTDNRLPFPQNNNNNVNPFPSMQSRPHFQLNPGLNQTQRHTLSSDPINTNRPPMPSNTINRPNFMQMSENRWRSPNPSAGTFYGINDNPSQQITNNSIRKYSAQTIDYNHRHENKDINPRIETPDDTQPYLPQKPMATPCPLNNNFYNQMNSSFSREVIDNFTKSNNSAKDIDLPLTEEQLTYRDKKYFTHPKSRIVVIDDLLKPPTREFRPENIVIILRGLPGSGKTFIAKLIKEKEMEFGRSAPRILSIDDYFMSEVERQIKSTETGKTVKTKEYVYEYEREMESCYRASLLKTYKKTLDDRLFSFIIIDAVNELIADITDFYSYAIKNDFTVYVIEMVSNDPLVCHKNNIHNRTVEDIKLIHKKWQTLPEFMLRLDIRSLLQNASIKNVEMEDNPPESGESLKRKAEPESHTSNKELKFHDSDDQSFNGETRVSRWERMEASESKLDKLDSFKMKTKPTIEEYLQVTDDYDLRLKDSKQKRVRWADIEEQKKYENIRQRGFVVGVDWHQFMDPQHPQRVLTETKYF